jgi:uridine kinase
MKVALLISGYLRSFKINIEQLKLNLLNHYNIDIYIHITNNEETKYINENIQLDDVLILKPKIMIVSDNLKFISNINNNINNIYNQNYKFYLLNQKRIEIERIENFKYDIVIKMRPDVYLKEKIILNPEKNYIYIPTDTKIDKNKLVNITDNYICDIIAYGDSYIMDKYFNIYLHLDELIKKYGNINETLLYNYLNDYNINYKLIDIQYIVILSLVNTIAITGDSGTGKTTLSNIIKELFNNSFILECDRYHKWERGDVYWNTITHLNPDANYITKMNNDVFDLKIGNNIYQVDYDHKTGKFTEPEYIKSNDNIIICGLHTLYMSDHIIDLKIYLDITDSIKIPWKIKRDISKRGYTIDKILKQIEDRKEDFYKYIYPQKYKADIIINLYNDINIVDYYNFDYTQEINYNLKIGINNKYNINKIINNLKIEKIEYEENFYFLFINNTLKEAITSIIINVLQSNHI